MLDQIVAQARAEAPNECCGIIGARDGSAVTVFPVRNAAASPLRYEMDPKDQLRVFEALDDADLDVGAIYHSHTRSDPVPSQTDVNLAKYGDDQPKFPGTLYLIVGVANSEPDVRLWSIVGNDYEQVEFEVTE